MKLNLTKNDLYEMIRESIDFLMESMSLGDIRKQYYGKIPEDIFNNILTADPTFQGDKMGKYGKWLLALYIKGNLNLNDLNKAKEFLSVFNHFQKRIQPNDIMRYPSLQHLFQKIKPFIENPDQATSKSDEIRRIKQGAKKVYEDSEWIVIVPKTKEASCYYGKGTKWCTAAEDGNNDFDHYNEQGNLYININKRTGEKFQFHFETSSFMDDGDYPIEQPVAETIGMTPGLIEFYKNEDDRGWLLDARVEFLINDGYYEYNLVKCQNDDYWSIKDNEGHMIANGILFDETDDDEDVDDQILRANRTLKNFNYALFRNTRGLYTIVSLTSYELEVISDSMRRIMSVIPSDQSIFSPNTAIIGFSTEKQFVIYNTDGGNVIYNKDNGKYPITRMEYKDFIIVLYNGDRTITLVSPFENYVSDHWYLPKGGLDYVEEEYYVVNDKNGNEIHLDWETLEPIDNNEEIQDGENDLYESVEPEISEKIVFGENGGERIVFGKSGQAYILYIQDTVDGAEYPVMTDIFLGRQDLMKLKSGEMLKNFGKYGFMTLRKSDGKYVVINNDSDLTPYPDEYDKVEVLFTDGYGEGVKSFLKCDKEGMSEFFLTPSVFPLLKEDASSIESVYDTGLRSIVGITFKDDSFRLVDLRNRNVSEIFMTPNEGVRTDGNAIYASDEENNPIRIDLNSLEGEMI